MPPDTEDKTIARREGSSAFRTSPHPPLDLVRPLAVFGKSFRVELSTSITLSPDTVMRAALDKNFRTFLEENKLLLPLRRLDCAAKGMHRRAGPSAMQSVHAAMLIPECEHGPGASFAHIASQRRSRASTTGSEIPSFGSQTTSQEGAGPGNSPASSYSTSKSIGWPCAPAKHRWLDVGSRAEPRRCAVRRVGTTSRRVPPQSRPRATTSAQELEVVVPLKGLDESGQPTKEADLHLRDGMVT